MTADQPRELYATIESTRFRRAGAKAMLRSHAEKPPVTLMRWVEADPLLAFLEQAAPAPGSSAQPTLTAGLVAVAARTLRACPELNTVKVGDEIRRMTRINVGVAVATEQGLVNPVIHDAVAMSVGEVACALGELAERAHGGQLRPEDLADGTFTLSSLGRWGVDFFTPIIPPPQAAILGVGRLQRRPHEVEGVWYSRSELPLSLTFDHAVVDGLDGATFLRTFAAQLASLDDPGA